jgi:hypothetical protein
MEEIIGSVPSALKTMASIATSNADKTSTVSLEASEEEFTTSVGLWFIFTFPPSIVPTFGMLLLLPVN